MQAVIPSGGSWAVSMSNNLFASKQVKNLLLLAVVVAVIYFGGVQKGFPPAQPGNTTGSGSKSDETLAQAFADHRRNVEVEGVGRVVHVLPDDDEGIEHQKFILELASGQELLVAHNTDVAPRIPKLRKGDVVEFRGEYEWNPQGGIVHWTHRDRQGRHADGWLKRDGEVYQ